VFTISSLAMLGLSLFVEVFFYWNIVAALLLMPLIVGWMQRRWVFWLHLLYGAVFVVGSIVNFTIVPLGNLLGRYDWTISSTFGWPGVADRINALRRTYDVGFVAATRYTTAAQLGFALHDADVVTIASRHDQYDYWFVPSAHEGEAALVVADPVMGTGEIAPFFDSLVPLETVSFEQYGYMIYQPTIYLGTGFHAAPKP
jgi:hypothetical protein